MQEFEVGKIKRLCFLVKKGEVKNIVVPYDSLADIDLKRFFDMEKQGGELMRVMRDTTLDNGVNALVMYQEMLVELDVPEKPKAVEVKKEAVKAAPAKEEILLEDEVVVEAEDDVKAEKPKKERKSKPRDTK